MLNSYLCFKTVNHCQFHSKKSIPSNVQWMRSISDMIRSAFLNLAFFIFVLLVFRPYQLMGVKRKLILVNCVGYCLDAIYVMALQALGISHSKLSTLQKIPLNVINVISAGWQIFLVANHFRMRRTRRQQVALFLQMIVPPCSILILSIPVAEIISPLSVHSTKRGKQTANCTLLSSHWSRFQSHHANMCSAVMPEHHSSGIFVCLVSAVVLCLSGHVSNFTSRT